MRIGPAVVLAASTAAFVRAHAMACDVVCVAEDRYESMLGRYKHVLVGRVQEQIDTSTGPEFRIKAIRVWKGKGNAITLRNVNGICGKTLTVGRAYVIFAGSARADIDICSPVMETSTKEAQVAITRLDRTRGLPPLSLPNEDLGRQRR
jgi:hypothetical protein